MNKTIYEKLKEIEAQNITTYSDIAPLAGLDMGWALLRVCCSEPETSTEGNSAASLIPLPALASRTSAVAFRRSIFF